MPTRQHRPKCCDYELRTPSPAREPCWRDMEQVRHHGPRRTQPRGTVISDPACRAGQGHVSALVPVLVTAAWHAVHWANVVEWPWEPRPPDRPPWSGPGSPQSPEALITGSRRHSGTPRRVSPAGGELGRPRETGPRPASAGRGELQEQLAPAPGPARAPHGRCARTCVLSARPETLGSQKKAGGELRAWPRAGGGAGPGASWENGHGLTKRSPAEAFPARGCFALVCAGRRVGPVPARLPRSCAPPGCCALAPHPDPYEAAQPSDPALARRPERARRDDGPERGRGRRLRAD